jgi:hypothetical protein
MIGCLFAIGTFPWDTLGSGLVFYVGAGPSWFDTGRSRTWSSV